MADEKHYEVCNLNCRIQCKTRVALIGDTFSFSEVLKPTILEGLLSVGKIKEVKSTKKSTKKSTSKFESKSSEEKTSKKSPKKDDKKKSD